MSTGSDRPRVLGGAPGGFRDRLRQKARGVAIRVLGMEFDTEERAPTSRPKVAPGDIDLSVIPKLVDGDGDTPGPNHREDIGRTWVAAQLAGGVAPYFIDLRPPAEVVAGTLPGARLLPGRLVEQRLAELPADREVRVTVFDQTGELGSAEVAAWLRSAGWPMARRLRGGYAEWLEHAEPIELPQPCAGGRLRPGDPVRGPDGREGRVLRSVLSPTGPEIEVYLPSGEVLGPVPEAQLLHGS
ncbi:MAG: rhodanese-like domain-containing protein [Deltaproteobacteria bacterium]|jgi:rhodanese-related sulfurtransferase|nr:rhodanese-like domain-containing protein [Deltaproteobacteria bacterium]